jgi:hypothetical protein
MNISVELAKTSSYGGFFALIIVGLMPRLVSPSHKETRTMTTS